MAIVLNPIGVIHSPYKEPKDMPIQGVFRPDVEAYAELYDEYREGLQDLEAFSHAILLYHFHWADKEALRAKPFLEQTTHGIFAIRSPNRPNRIGLSVVRIVSVSGNRLTFKEVDVLDGTPLLDIKPYVKHFDVRDGVVCGWLDKHFQDGRVLDGTVPP